MKNYTNPTPPRRAVLDPRSSRAPQSQSAPAKGLLNDPRSTR
jgi:hypothetical protein